MYQADIIIPFEPAFVYASTSPPPTVMLTTALRQQATRSTRLAVGRSSTRLLATKPPRPPPSDPSSRPKSSSSSTPVDHTPNNVPPVPKEELPLEAVPQEAAQQPLNVSILPSLDFDPASSPLKGGRTGARSAKDSPSTIEAKKKRLGRVTMALVASGLVAGWVFMGRDWEEGEKIPTKEASYRDPPDLFWSLAPSHNAKHLVRNLGRDA